MPSDFYSIDLAFSRSIPGDVIELQKLVGDYFSPNGGQQNDNIMIGYVTIKELCTTFGTPLRSTKAVHLFLRMMMRVTWAAVMAEAKRKTTKNANISESEIQKHIGMIRNVLNNEPVVVEALRKSMSKYFKDLSLEKDTATLAAHIGNQAVKRHLCYRRNSSSLSAASVYLACQLQGMRTTQNSFCKIVGLTEVTLRKVYKELKNHWPQLVPDNYKPFRGGAGPLPPRTRPTHYGWKESTQRQQQQQQQRKVVLVASKGYDLVDGLQDFQVPKQYTSDGRDIWAKEEGGGGRRISDAAVELLQEYPRPKEVYAALSAQCSDGAADAKEYY
eukprot:jgi/Bigna1/67459/fgenesh1_pg.3_\